MADQDEAPVEAPAEEPMVAVPPAAEPVPPPPESPEPYQVDIIVVQPHYLSRLSADAVLDTTCPITQTDCDCNAATTTVVRYSTTAGVVRHQAYDTYQLAYWLEINHRMDPWYRGVYWDRQCVDALMRRLRSTAPFGLWVAIWLGNLVALGLALLLVLLSAAMLLVVGFFGKLGSFIYWCMAAVQRSCVEQNVYFWPDTLWLWLQDFDCWAGRSFIGPVFFSTSHDIAALVDYSITRTHNTVNQPFSTPITNRRRRLAFSE